MANKQFKVPINLVNLASDPASASEGDIYFNTTDDVVKVYANGAWVAIGAGGGGGSTISVGSTAPLDPEIGDGWYDTTDTSFAIWDGTFWVEVTSTVSLSQEQVQDYVAPLLNHSNHTNITATYDDDNNQILLTGSTSVSDEQVQDAIAPLFDHSSHVNITASYDDESNKIILTGSTSVSDEDLQDAIAPLFEHLNHTNLTATYDDENNEILLSVDAGSGITISSTAPSSPSEGDGWYNNENGSFYLYDGSYWVEVNGIINGLTQEQVQDYVAPLFDHEDHTNVTVTYDDLNNKIILNTSADITNIDSIVYPDYITFDTTPETAPTETGSIFWDSGDGLPKAILNAEVDLGIGQESVALVKNATGSSIPKGSVVYINGAQGQRPTIALADADLESTSSKTFGFTAQTIADEAEGFVVTEGVLRGINTNGLTEGGAVWLSSTAGGFTQTMPIQPVHGVFLGYVVKASSTSGEIFVKIQNGYELNELHNVLISGTPTDNSLLAYDTTSGLWKNQTATEAGLLTGAHNPDGNLSLSISGSTLIASLATNVTVAGDAVIGGSLTVNGTTTTLNTENLLIEDNQIVLNSNVTGSPTLNAGVEVERGTSGNVSIRWNEDTDVWEYTNDGVEYKEIGSGAGTIVSATAPAEPEEGMTWFNTADNILYVYDGTYWIEVTSIVENSLLFTVSTTEPALPIEGMGWFNPETASFFIYDGTFWIEVATIIENTYPDQSGNGGKFLTTDGTDVSWASVDALPSQTGNDGKYLTTDGTDASWADIAGAVYQDEAPTGVPTGTIWVDSDASSATINTNDFVLKSEAESYTPHGFLLMGA